MKRTVEPDTLDIADRLGDLKQLSAAIAIGLEGAYRVHDPEAIGGLAELARRLSEGLGEVSDEVHPKGQLAA